MKEVFFVKWASFDFTVCYVFVSFIVYLIFYSMVGGVWRGSRGGGGGGGGGGGERGRKSWFFSAANERGGGGQNTTEP